jgi:hypothetical protein
LRDLIAVFRGAIVFGSEEKAIAVCGEERDHMVTPQLT